jgi:S-adenosylmethionine:tRNA ribosyltransferase-isomerase
MNASIHLQTTAGKAVELETREPAGDLSAFDFHLPEELIAQHPTPGRSQSRLLVWQGGQAEAQHARFDQLLQWLRPGDLLVYNRSRVIRARLQAQRPSGGRLEVFLLGLPADPARTAVLLRPAKRVQLGQVLSFPFSGSSAEVIGKEAGMATLRFASQESLGSAMQLDGSLPLPPYIRRPAGPSAEDERRYQTVFADAPGAVAAPTAGLHFDEQLLASLAQAGVQSAAITLHVGWGTFRPISCEDYRQHAMELERGQVDESVARQLNQARAEGRRIIAVGTTTTRCLESIFEGSFPSGPFQTGIFIYPGYRFRAIDGLITNFHLPRSSLLLLVAALIGTQNLQRLYQDAVQRAYRFYSYGDAMLLLPNTAKEPPC